MSTHIEKKVTDEVLINIRKIIQMIDIHSRYLVKQFGLTGPQLAILQEVSQREEISVGELANAISLSQATVTGILERLDKRNLITRSRSEKDRRKVLVKSTPECDKLLSQAPPLLQESFVDKFHLLQEWEQSMILSSLQRIVSMMDAKQIEAAPMLATGQLHTQE